jgi:putative SOS response-associated peptidase YedK
MLGFAGIWDRWKSPNGDLLHSFSTIIGEPNELVAPIHNRMPVILPPEKYFQWLSPSTSVEDARALL